MATITVSGALTGEPLLELSCGAMIVSVILKKLYPRRSQDHKRKRFCGQLVQGTEVLDFSTIVEAPAALQLVKQPPLMAAMKRLSEMFLNEEQRRQKAVACLGDWERDLKWDGELVPAYLGEFDRPCMVDEGVVCAYKRLPRSLAAVCMRLDRERLMSLLTIAIELMEPMAMRVILDVLRHHKGGIDFNWTDEFGMNAVECGLREVPGLERQPWLETVLRTAEWYGLDLGVYGALLR